MTTTITFNSDTNVYRVETVRSDGAKWIDFGTGFDAAVSVARKRVDRKGA